MRYRGPEASYKSTLQPALDAEGICAALRCGRPGCPCTRPGGLVHCPAHDDGTPSLSVVGRDGRVLVRCHAGCSQAAVIDALRSRGLWPASTSGARPRRGGRTTTRYEVRDPGGRLVAVHVREDGPGGKSFRWEGPDGRRGLDGLRVTELPLYAVERLGASDRAILVEGEKATEALLHLGLPAVGSVTGAAAVPCDASLEPLRGRTVFLWPDADPPGLAHMQKIAHRLHALGHADVRWVTWQDAPPGGDAADLVASGATREDVERLLGQAAAWRPPEAPDGAELLRDLEGYFSKYLVLPPGVPLVLAAWVMATRVVDVFEVAPYLAITSAEKRCGKTTLLDLLAFVVREPLVTANISEAALFRVVEERRPTLLIDEAQVLRDRTERSAALHDLLAAGHVRGRPAYRVAKAGEGFRLESYDAFGFKALALIGELTDILADRSIRIRMHRRAPHEPVERFRRLRVKTETEPLRRRLEAWALANEARVREVYQGVEPPAWMNDRAADNWSALWAVVEVAAPSRLPDLEAAARALEGDDSGLDRESLGVRLLSDLRRVFEERQADWLRTETLLEDLRADPEAPWAGWKGRGLTAHGLARILRRYGVQPEQRRVGDQVVRGYSEAALRDVWSRYLAAEALKPLQVLQLSQDAASGPESKPLHEAPVAVSKSSSNPRNDGIVALVAVSECGGPPGPGALDRATQEPEEVALPEWGVRLAEQLPRRPETDPGAVARAAAALLEPPLGPEDLFSAADQDPPVEPCWCCRGRRWWLRPRHLGGGWVCVRCHPPGPVVPAGWHEVGADGPDKPAPPPQPEEDPPAWWMDGADPDPGDPEEEPPDWPDAWPEADPVEVVV
jgi:hypothetical protein